MIFKLQCLIAIVIYRLGFKPNVSTGICGSTTYGYGELDSNGYWQYPLYLKD